MNKKLVIRLAPLLAIAAFAMAPAAAQAFTHSSTETTTHWNDNSTPLAERTPTIGWGNLKLESVAGNIECRNAAATNMSNPKPGGKSVAQSEVVMFATYECKAEGGECTAPAEERATALNLLQDEGPPNGPAKFVWPSRTYREETTKLLRAEGLAEPANQIEVGIECWAGGEKIGGLTFVSGGPNHGTSEPKWQNNGPNAEKPSESIFDEHSGHLQASANTEFPVETEVGEVKLEAGKTNIENIVAGAGSPWGPLVKEHVPPGNTKSSKCYIKSPALFPNEFIELKTSADTGTLGNEVNPSKNFGLASGTFPYEVKCGPHIAIAIEGSTRGKVKVSPYLGGPVGLMTIANGEAPEVN